MIKCIECKSENVIYNVLKKAFYCYDCFTYFDPVKLTDFIDGDKI